MPALSPTLLAATSPWLGRDPQKALGPAEGARAAVGQVRPARTVHVGQSRGVAAVLRELKKLGAVIPAHRDARDRGWERL